MPESLSQQHEILINKLRGLATLSNDDIEALQSLPVRERNLRAGTTIITEGQIVSECCLLLSGFAYRHKVARDGSRQIVSFHMAGDLLDIQQLLFDQADHNVQIMTDAEVAFIPVSSLRDLIKSRTRIATALWRDSLVDASVFREWVLNVGRRPGIERVAHMLCEFVTRCEAAGLSEGRGIVIPMTQEHIADATGLTAVHVNRVMRALREQGLISGAGRQVTIGNWEGMCQLADFRPAYLHLAA